MVVIISSKVHVVADCNYTCARYRHLEGECRWGLVGSILRHFVHSACVDVGVWVWDVQRLRIEEKKTDTAAIWTICNETTKQQKSNIGVIQRITIFFFLIGLLSVKSTVQ